MSDRITYLEQRVEKLETAISQLVALPEKIDMLIDIQNDIKNQNQMYASKELCNQKHENIQNDVKELKEFRKWVYISIIGCTFTVILELIKFMGAK